MNAFCDGSDRRRQGQGTVSLFAGKVFAAQRTVMRGTIIATTVILGGCSWFSNDEPAFPPTSGGPNIAAVATGLPGDSANAEYTDQELRALLGSAPRPLPAPPEKPKTADTNAPDATQPDASAEPATATAPQPNGVPPAAGSPVPVAPDAATNDPSAYPDINTVPMQRPTPAPDPDAPTSREKVKTPDKPQQSSMLEPDFGRMKIVTTAGSSPAAPMPDLPTSDQVAQSVTNSDNDMFSKPVLPPYSGFDQTQKQPQGVPAQSLYRSPYSGPTQLGGAAAGYNGSVVYASQTDGAGAQVVAAPGGQPVGLVYFGIGSTQLGGSDRSVLQQIAALQRAYGGVIRIVGHASSRTENMPLDKHYRTNAEIAQARAKAVASQLVRYGVRPLFVQIAGAGDSQPLYPEFMPAGEAANRRAEIYLSSN
jgi:flagellar motor protein MotB